MFNTLQILKVPENAAVRKTTVFEFFFFYQNSSFPFRFSQGFTVSPGDSRSVAFVFLLVYIYGLYLTQSVHLHRLETGDQAAAVKFTINEGRKTMISYDIILYFIVHLIIQHIHRHIIYLICI